MIVEIEQEEGVEEIRQKKLKNNNLGFRRGGAAVPAGQPPSEPHLPLAGKLIKKKNMTEEREESFC